MNPPLLRHLAATRIGIATKALAILTAFLALATAGLAGTDKFPDISQEELATAVAAKTAVIFDVNGSDSYKSGHIPGAIDYMANQDRLASLLPANKSALVVAYCYNPQCHAYALAAEAAAKLGYSNIKHYRPGITGWLKSGAPVEKGD